MHTHQENIPAHNLKAVVIYDTSFGQASRFLTSPQQAEEYDGAERQEADKLECNTTIDKMESNTTHECFSKSFVTGQGPFCVKILAGGG